MKKLNLSYFHYYKKNYGWTGHFWQGRFKNQPVGKDSYFLQCGKYIELNPVRAGLVKNPYDYLFSSYRYYVSGEKNDLITKDFIYSDLGKTEKTKQDKYQEMLISDIVLENYQTEIWGSNKQRYNESRKIRRRIN
jgi:putative transposase